MFWSAMLTYFELVIASEQTSVSARRDLSLRRNTDEEFFSIEIATVGKQSTHACPSNDNRFVTGEASFS